MKTKIFQILKRQKGIIIFEEIRPSNDYSSIDQYQKVQNPQYENLLAKKPRKKLSFRIVAVIIVASIVVLVVILSVILAILATTSNL